MIDVWGTVSSGLWIAGLAVLLAVLSWAHWIATGQQTRMRVVLGRAHPRQVLHLGLALFCAGLAATGRAWWERILWWLLTGIWVIRVWAPKALHHRFRPGTEASTNESVPPKDR
jgi:hypothetical protein